jgi:hypothetical protein
VRIATNLNERIREVFYAAHELVAFFEELLREIESGEIEEAKRDIRAAIAKVQKGDRK